MFFPFSRTVGVPLNPPLWKALLDFATQLLWAPSSTHFLKVLVSEPVDLAGQLDQLAVLRVRVECLCGLVLEQHVVVRA